MTEVTFKKTWFSNKVVSSEGFSIEILSRTLVVYRDRAHNIFVSVEKLTPYKRWALFADDMWVGSQNGTKLTNDTVRTLVIGRIQEAFTFLGFSMELS